MWKPGLPGPTFLFYSNHILVPLKHEGRRRISVPLTLDLALGPDHRQAPVHHKGWQMTVA